MIGNRPSLKLNKLIIRNHSNNIVYQEFFNSGVNIIRGENSSGKSTILNFIFYVLGGAFQNWTTGAKKCKDVTAELIINGAFITLKREISDSNLTALQVYWGNNESSKDDNLNWNIYPYKSTENIVSFSNILFDALGFPEVKNDMDSNITMHQILRLLYIDQETPPQSLFRIENFDPPLTRKTISEILLGIYDDQLYTDRINVRNLGKELELKEREFKNLIDVVSQSGKSTNLEGIQKALDSTKEEVNKINNDIQKLRVVNSLRTTKNTITNTEKIKNDLILYKNKISNITSKINQYDLEIADSKQFISTLEKRISELNDSRLTRQIIGDLTLTHCPQCLSALENHNDHICILCKEPIAEEAEKANAKRLLQEMQLQVKESKKLLEVKEQKYLELTSSLPSSMEKVRFYQKELDLSIENSQSTRDEKIDTLLISKGFIESKLENLMTQIKVVELIEKLKSEISEFKAQIKNLKLSISQKEADQSTKYSAVMNKIKDITLKILRKDLPRQSEFQVGKVIEVDFLRDSFSLDGSNNFSASSKTYFKNALLFSIFFTSLEYDFMRYPRFILCDNMEDKGMEKERTQNFQEIITNLSNEYLLKGKEHQIIFTTSEISDKLNNTKYCVGDYYNNDNKTLKI